jgi:hypothetical protein
METIVKNFHLLNGILSEENLDLLTHGALQYRKFARISFKILSVSDGTIKVQTVQGKTPQGNFADEETLIQRTKELFGKFLPNYKIIVNATEYRESPAEQVTPEFIRHNMTELKIKVKDLVSDTGIDRANIAAWMNGNRDMSQPVKALLYYYFLNRRRDITRREHTPPSLFTARIEDDTYKTLLLTPMHDYENGPFRVPLGEGAKGTIEHFFNTVQDGKQIILKGG